MIITELENIYGEPIVNIEHEDGSVTSMTKAQYDEMTAKQNDLG